MVLIWDDGVWFWNQISLWNVSSSSGSLFCVGSLWYRPEAFDFKISFLFEFESSSSRLLNISWVRLVFFGDLLLIQNKGYYFCNQISLWNVLSALRLLIVAIVRQVHFEWLAFDIAQRFSDFKINFLFDFVSSVSWLLIISRVIHVLYDDSPLVQNKEYWFSNQISFWNVSSASRLIVARGSHGHFSG